MTRTAVIDCPGDEVTDGALVIVGTAGAEPERLARVLCESGWAGRVTVARSAVDIDRAGAHVAVLALDSSMPADEEEDRMLAALAHAALPTALAACCVDAHPSWPRVLAASRERLDPDRRLPVFATAAALFDEDDRKGGVAELAAWCLEVFEAGEPERERLPRPRASSIDRGACTASTPSRSERSLAMLRADRMAGLRAGIVAARAETAAATRAALAEINRLVPEVGASDGFVEWLPRTLDGVERRAQQLFVERLAQVRASALCGLASGGELPQTEPTGSVDPPAPRLRRTNAEDVTVLLVGASMGFGVGRMVIAPALAWVGLGTAGTVLSVVAGLLLALWAVSLRRRAAELARIERWAAEVIAVRRATVEQWIGTRSGAAEAHISREIWNRTRLSRV